MRSDRRIRLYLCTGLLSAALCAAAVVAMIGVPGLLASTGAVPAGTVDVNAPVTSQTQCAPCHSLTKSTDMPGVIYDHQRHDSAVGKPDSGVGCGGCHWGPAHTSDKIIVGSPMASCFVSGCHDVPYASSPTVSGKCAVCHPKTFNLIPKGHIPGFAGRPHVAPARADENSCLVCHDPKGFCDACHRSRNVKAKATQAAYKPVTVPTPSPLPPLLIETSGTVAMGKCVPCHPSIDRFPKTRVTFAHSRHFNAESGKGFPARCQACHTRYSHVPDRTLRPTMQDCYACHGVSHVASSTISTQKTVAITRCGACHPKSFVLKPKTHTVAFAKKQHPKQLVKNPEMCNMCHPRSYCAACHQGKPATRGGPPRRKVMPAGHRSSDFVGTHGVAYKKGDAVCSACHDGSTCRKCHKTALPHPADWLSQHPLSKSLETSDCNVCHQDKRTCQQCHHNALKDALLIAVNCVSCHPTITTRPLSAIRNRGLAEHAAHFRRGSSTRTPLRCERCHVGFVMSLAARMITQTKGHDTRLCFSCHGVKDKNGKLIAPYSGDTLCLRCHKDLKL